MVESAERGSMVGRDAELAHLEAALASVSGGHGRTIVIGGEAGIGKTRIVAALAADAAAHGTAVLAGDCLPSGAGALPYAPFVAAIRGLIRSTDPAAVPGILGASRAEIARLVPDVAQGRSAGQESADDRDDRGGQGRLFEAMLGLIERQSTGRSLLQIVEDIQWADAGTRDLLAFLSRNLRAAPVLIIATVRTEAIGDDPAFARWLAELERASWVERMELQPLRRAQVAALLRSLHGTPPSPETVDTIAVRSGGNPFFLEQLAAVSSEARDRELPPRLHDVLAARLGELPESTQIVLRAAAAAGRRVDDEVLASVLGLSPGAVADALRPAVRQGILIDTEDIDGRAAYTFQHVLLAEVAEAELLHGERDRLHAAFGLELERRSEVDSAGVTAAELAYHWVAARDRQRAVPALVDAGLAAERVYAFADARRYFESALSMWLDDPDVESATNLDRIAVLQHAAESSVLSGAYAEAVAFGRQAIIAAELADVIGGTQDPARLGALHDRLRWYLWESGDRRSAEAAVGEALRLIPAEPPSALRARALGQAAGVRLLAGKPAEAAPMAEDAIRVARAAHAASEEAFALGVLGWSLALTEDVDRGIATYREGLVIAERLGGVEGIALGHANLAALLDRVGRSGASVDAAREGFAITQRLGVARTYGGGLLGHAAKALFDLGRWDEAADAADQGLALDPLGPSVVWLHINRARVDTNRGRFDEAAEHLRAAGGIAAGGDQYRLALLAARLELAVWRHEPESIREALSTVLALADAELPFDPALGRLAWYALRAEADSAMAARARQDEAAIREIAARVVPIERRVADRRNDLSGPADARDAAVAGLCDGESARLRGLDAPDVWERTAVAWEDLGRPALVAYARYRAGEAVLAGRGDRALAASQLRTAHALAVQLGARPLVEEIEALARHGRIALPEGTAEGPSRDPLGLTEREAEVMRLVAAGRSNQQIADALFITRKTASVHVSNIIGKLGVSNRVEAAAVAQRLGLGSDARD